MKKWCIQARSERLSREGQDLSRPYSQILSQKDSRQGGEKKKKRGKKREKMILTYAGPHQYAENLHHHAFSYSPKVRPSTSSHIKVGRSQKIPTETACDLHVCACIHIQTRALSPTEAQYYHQKVVWTNPSAS